MRIIAVANQKGGCGKTTTSINLSAAIALLHKKTLLIDLDPQGHSTCGLGFDARKIRHSVYDLLSLHEAAAPVFEEVKVEVSNNFHLLPAYEILSALEEELIHSSEREKRLQTFLEQLKRGNETSYDYVILDCPPNLGVLTSNAFEAADEVIIPVEPSFFSLHGLAKISETIELYNHRRLVPLEVHALLTLFDARTKFAKEIYEEVKTHFGPRLFKAIIHECVSLKEAAGAGKSIVDYDQGSSGFKDYFHLAVEYLEREWDRKLPEEHLGWENTIRKKYAPRYVPGGILFQAFFKEAREVEIVGDFNQWIPEFMICRDGTGLWQKILPLPKGTYHYKLIVDGEWQIDPGHAIQQANSFGTLDSVLEVQ